MDQTILRHDSNGDYCPTCGSCGKVECCPPMKCKFGLSYIDGLNKEIQTLKLELEKTRKALAHYIKKTGFEPTKQTIDNEVKFYGN